MPFPSRILITLVAAATLVVSVPFASSTPAPPLPLSGALQQATLRTQVTGNSRDQLRLTITNTAPDSARVTVPAGVILKGSSGERVVVLRSAEITVAPQSTADAEIPTAALSSRNAPVTQSFSLDAETEPKLDAFLKFLATNNDVPRPTSQLVVLALLENITFGRWEQFLALTPGTNSKAAADIVQAIDALGLLRVIAPAEAFALASDNGLKLRALRNPVTRAKAVQIYGIGLPDEPGLPPAEAPNLKQLLHSQPGDNCPVCRMREQTGRGAGDF